MRAATVVDYWFDPICPYSWIGSRWLLEVERRRPLAIRWHVMSLYLLNADRDDDPSYTSYLREANGATRVATAVMTIGSDALRDVYSAFGALIFDHWRYPGIREYRTAMATALERTGLPPRLMAAFDSTEQDEELRRSHATALVAVGDEAGTPITRVDGDAFYGPVLSAIPRGEAAARVFDGARLLAGCSDFFEIKRTRTAEPVYT